MSTGGTMDPNLTATAGITFLLTLTPTQASLVTGLVDIQKPSLYEIVDRRRDFLPGWQVKVDLPIVISAKSRLGAWRLLKLPDTGQVTDHAPTFGEASD
jgi:hypothetical protein